MTDSVKFAIPAHERSNAGPLRPNQHLDWDESVDGPRWTSDMDDNPMGHHRPSARRPKLPMPEGTGKERWFDHGPLVLTDGSSPPMPRVPQFRGPKPLDAGHVRHMVSRLNGKRVPVHTRRGQIEVLG